MAWPGLTIALQWAACLAILAWAVWLIAMRMTTMFAPKSKRAGCHGCAHCSPPAMQTTQSAHSGDGAPPADCC